MVDSYFTDDSAFRRIHGQRMVAFGGPRAVLLQGAHPLTMAGLVAHSNRLEDFRQRLARTLQIIQVIGFGDRTTADHLLAEVYTAHSKVRGTLKRSAGRFSAGTPYSALDPELQLWILFTMADSAMLAHDTFVRPLTTSEREEFWADWKRIGRLFGLTETVLPETTNELDAYRREMLEGDTLHVTEGARRWIKRAVLDAPVPLPMLPLKSAIDFVTTNFLPDHVREGYGLGKVPPMAVRRPIMRIAAAGVRTVLPLLPESIRISREARAGSTSTVDAG